MSLSPQVKQHCIDSLYNSICHPEREAETTLLWDMVRLNASAYGLDYRYFSFRNQVYYRPDTQKKVDRGIRVPALHINLHPRMAGFLQQKKEFDISMGLCIKNYLIALFASTEDLSQIAHLLPEKYTNDVYALDFDTPDREKVMSLSELAAFKEANEKYLIKIKIRQVDDLLGI